MWGEAPYLDSPHCCRPTGCFGRCWWREKHRLWVGLQRQASMNGFGEGTATPQPPRRGMGPESHPNQRGLQEGKVHPVGLQPQRNHGDNAEAREQTLTDRQKRETKRVHPGTKQLNCYPLNTHTHTRTCTYTNTHIHTHEHTYMHRHTNTCAHTCTPIHIYINTIHTHTHINTHIQNAHTYTHILLVEDRNSGL